MAKFKIYQFVNRNSQIQSIPFDSSNISTGNPNAEGVKSKFRHCFGLELK